MLSSSTKKALFLDRDGVFNEIVFRDGATHSPRNWDETRHYSGLEKLTTVKQRGYLLIMVTNQPDIERGIVPQTFADELHAFYQKKYQLDAIYVCPFASNDHPDKKPNPGLFLKAAQDLSLTLSACFHLGDTENDLVAAQRCGCTGILWDRSYNKELKADHRITKFEEIFAVLD